MGCDHSDVQPFVDPLNEDSERPQQFRQPQAVGNGYPQGQVYPPNVPQRMESNRQPPPPQGDPNAPKPKHMPSKDDIKDNAPTKVHKVLPR